jgi:bifunctional non-homologous end joining protein LigD
VVQKHDATRLHYDFRLESEDGVLKSWAVPKGPSMNPKIKRLAVMVEDHPFDYLHFEGTIPTGNYGAGTVIVWDTGSYSSREPVLKQIDEGKVTVELYGNKLKGLFKLVKTRKENQWLLIKAQDKFASEDDLTALSPESVLSNKTNSDMESEPEAIFGSRSKVSKKSNSASKKARSEEEYISQELFPKIKPMLAHPFEKAFDNKEWVFEVKWDGVRALLFKKDREIKIQSRNGNNITPQYPEVVAAAKLSLRDCNSAILDGEIVVLNEDGLPDFHTHQHRMHIQSTQEIMAMSVEHPSTYYVFDILYKDDHSVEGLGYIERRELLSSTLKTNDTIKISEFIEEKGTAILASSKKLKLEGIVAKHKSSIYREGIRSRDWLKIKNTKTQDCVIIGYTEGLGNRVRHFGSLVLAVYSTNENKLKFA